MYRLLDAVVSFHCGLPVVGEKIVYDIHIDKFVKQGDSVAVSLLVRRQGERRAAHHHMPCWCRRLLHCGGGSRRVRASFRRHSTSNTDPARSRMTVSARICAAKRECAYTAACQWMRLRDGDLVAAFGPGL